MLATIDVLSGGRLIIGIGAGWLKVESTPSPPRRSRNAARSPTNTSTPCAPSGPRHTRLPRQIHQNRGLLVDPKPVQKPHPPIWVGGETGPSMRRAARVGDVWYPIGSNKANMLDTLPRPQAGIARMRELTGQAGRDPAAMGIVYRVKRHGQPAPLATDGHRKLFTGTVANTIEDIAAVKAHRRHRAGFRLRGPGRRKSRCGHEKIPLRGLV